MHAPLAIFQTININAQSGSKKKNVSYKLVLESFFCTFHQVWIPHAYKIVVPYCRRIHKL
jgi:hypothetical protein